MCGIAGEVRFGAVPASREVARKMAATLGHRGPDELSAWSSVGERCAFGHTRLRVIDLETGDQPMASEDGAVQVVFNGEIYNFRELREELERRGHHFRTRSDTEVIVHGYREWGDAVAEHLDGMFAFALWDEPRRRLMLARDRVGKKPLFLARTGDGLVFGSEMKAVVAHPEVAASPDPGQLLPYLMYGYVPGPATFYAGVEKLPPAHCLVVDAEGREELREYWSSEWRAEPLAGSDPVAEVRALMEQAVRRRLVADVPLGAFLSGGIDSSIVVGLMSRMTTEPVKTFSIGFSGDDSYDETRYARMVAERFGTEHTEFAVGPGSIDLIDRLVRAYDEPFGDSSAIPTFIVSELTREHVTVALTGDGGDEAFAGYLRFYGAMVAERIPGTVARLGHQVGRLLPHGANFRSPSRRVARFFSAAALPLDERMLRWIGFFPEEGLPGGEGLVRPEHRSVEARDVHLRSFRERIGPGPGRSTLARVLDLNFHTYLPEDLLVKADRCSMAHGLELRSPFLDTAVLEFAQRLPDRWRIRRGRTKILLREAFGDLIPAEAMNRPKMGFGVPLPTWFRNEWRPAVEDRLFGDRARIWEWLRPEPVRRIFDEHLAGTADYGHQLWALLTLESWLRQQD